MSSGCGSPPHNPRLRRQRKGIPRANWLARLAVSGSSGLWDCVSTIKMEEKPRMIPDSNPRSPHICIHVCPHICNHAYTLLHTTQIEKGDKGVAKWPPYTSSTKFSTFNKSVPLSLMCMHELPRQLKVHADPYDGLTTPTSAKLSSPWGKVN